MMFDPASMVKKKCSFIVLGMLLFHRIGCFKENVGASNLEHCHFSFSYSIISFV